MMEWRYFDLEAQLYGRREATDVPRLDDIRRRRKLIDLDQSKAASTGRFIRMLAIPLTGLRTCPPDRKVLPWKRSPNWLKKYLIKSLTL